MPMSTIDASHDDLVDTLRLCLGLRRGAADSQGAVGAVRHRPGRRWRRRRANCASVQGVGPKLAQKIAGADHEIDVEAEIALCREHGIDILTESHAAYPRALREIHDPPGVLFVRGAVEAERRPGRRHCRHAARHAIRPAAGRAAGRRTGPGRA